MRRTAVLVLSISLAAPALAGAQTPDPGGAQAPGRPSISALVCADGRPSECARGSKLRIVGENLNAVQHVRFLGRPGRSDDRVSRPRGTAQDELIVVVPQRTRSGPVEVDGWAGSARAASIRITTEAPPVDEQVTEAPAGDAVFPIRGAHTFGSAISRFGGGRGHQGHDTFAACGTPLVAAMGGRVIKAAYQSRAGNYVVIQHADGRSTAYMHMRRPATVELGDQVAAGDAIGEVGETGRATGCHLHFELWTAPGWYRGGRPVDPLPLLRSLDARSAKST